MEEMEEMGEVLGNFQEIPPFPESAGEEPTKLTGAGIGSPWAWANQVPPILRFRVSPPGGDFGWSGDSIEKDGSDDCPVNEFIYWG